MGKKPLHYVELYKLSKTGKPQVYMLSIIDNAPLINFDCYTLVTEKGFVDGAMQIDEEEFTEGKNIGRSNETTAKQQALIMLNSKKNKLLDKGYKEIPVGRDTLEFLRESSGTGALGKRLPMLAQDDQRRITGKGHAQRKYDGIRSFVEIIDFKITKLSKRGKPQLNMGHLDPYLREFNEKYPGDWYLDAELYRHGKSLQKILSLVQRGQQGNSMMGLRVYDLVPMAQLDMCQYDRMRLLKKVRRETKEFGWPIEFVPTIRVTSQKVFRYLRAKWLREKYEGAIWRTDEGAYEFGIRSYYLIKSKPVEEKEFEIVGAEEATGRDKGTAIFILKTEKGVIFKARPMGSREVRRNYLINIKDYIGEQGTVIFRGYTDDGKPKEARFKVVRNYE